MAGGDRSGDPREPAWEAVRETPSASAIKAVIFVGGAAGTAAAVGGGAALLGAFSLPFMAGLVAMTIATWPISFAILEIVRLGKSHRLLREVLDSERVYDSLLADVRQERNDLHAEVQRLRLDAEMTRSAQDLVGALGERFALPAPKRNKRKDSDDG